MMRLLTFSVLVLLTLPACITRPPCIVVLSPNDQDTRRIRSLYADYMSSHFDMVERRARWAAVVEMRKIRLADQPDRVLDGLESGLRAEYEHSKAKVDDLWQEILSERKPQPGH